MSILNFRLFQCAKDIVHYQPSQLHPSPNWRLIPIVLFIGQHMHIILVNLEATAIILLFRPFFAYNR
jgi:hypothetical protein